MFHWCRSAYGFEMEINSRYIAMEINSICFELKINSRCVEMEINSRWKGIYNISSEKVIDVISNPFPV